MILSVPDKSAKHTFLKKFASVLCGIQGTEGFRYTKQNPSKDILRFLVKYLETDLFDHVGHAQITAERQDICLKQIAFEVLNR